MELANLKVIKDWQKSQNGVPPAKEVAKSDEQISVPIRKGLHLDVDEILRHSLPKVSSQSKVYQQEIDE